MDVKLRMVPTERGREHTFLGFDQIDIIEFGFASDGTLGTVLCVAEYSSKDGPTGTFGLFPIMGEDIDDDLLMNYEVKVEAPVMPMGTRPIRCDCCKLRHPLDQSCPVGFTTDF